MTVSCAVHIPICLPSGEQTDWPAEEHAPVDGPAEETDGVVEPGVELVIAEGGELGAAATAGEGATGEKAASAEGGAAAEGEGAAADGAAEGATDGATDGAADAGEADDPVEPDADPGESEELASEALVPDDPHLGPVGGVSVPDPNFSTEVPGSGNCTSWESTVSQSLVGVFALNMAGKDGAARADSSGMPRVSLREAALFFDPPLTFTEAQFIYISRLPILLNHVQASV